MSSKPTTHDQRSSIRKENFARKKGREHESGTKVPLYEKLLFGFSDFHEAMASMHVSTSTRAIHLPISTRAIGFTVRYLTRKFARLGIAFNHHAFCCALYRVSLFMYEFKISCASSVSSARNAPGPNFLSFDIPADTIRVLGQLGVNFTPIINLLSSIGVLHAFNTTFVPHHPMSTVIDGVRQIEPTMITASNLRETVEAMANPVTNQATRQWFYDHNPLPNARWNVPARRRDADGQPVLDPGFPVLMNADEIMPANFMVQNLREDVNLLQDALELIGRKYPKYVHLGRIDFSGSGNYSMLVSNQPGDVKCGDLIWNNVNQVLIPDYQNSPAIVGGSQHFWSIDKLSEPEFYTGVLHLLGEFPQNPPVTFSVRRLEVSKQESEHTFADALGNLVG